MDRSWAAVAVLCGLTLAGCGGGAGGPAAFSGDVAFSGDAALSGDVALSGDTLAGFAVPSAVPTTAPNLSLPVARTKGCVMVRQDNASGQRACIPPLQVCSAGSVWWARDLDGVCGGPLRPQPIRVVSAPNELPVGAALCVVWAGTPADVREAVLVVASAHANCATGLMGAVLAPPAAPLAAAFPRRRPDCGVHFPGTRRAWPAKVEFVDPPGKAWACLVG